MREALRLARRGYGLTSPNPMVGAVLVKGGRMIGRGWHHGPGRPHAEIEALRFAQSQGRNAAGATLYVSLEPCSTWGRTPPCTEALMASGLRRLVAAATDPNPVHQGRGFKLLAQAGIEITRGVLEAEAERLNEAFNHWVVNQTPFVTVKAAMTMDGKIATTQGDSRWITGDLARLRGMRLRAGSDAVLVGVNTVLRDNPRLTVRGLTAPFASKKLRRIVVDSLGRTPPSAHVVSDPFRDRTTVVVTRRAPRRARTALAQKVKLVIAPLDNGKVDLRWLLARLGAEEVASLLVEGGGEIHAAFLRQRLAQRVAFFYAPKLLCGRHAFKAVAGPAWQNQKAAALRAVEWRAIGQDLFLTARLV